MINLNLNFASVIETEINVSFPSFQFVLEGYHFFFMNIVHTNKYNIKLQSPGALNIKETPGYKQKENVKKIMITNK